MTKPILSVLIDTYNQERYIEQAVVSALEQDLPPTDYEIVVVDDGSTDRTPEIVRKFAPRVRLLRKRNGGQASAFNAAFPELRGEFVSFLDGDDWYAKGKLAATLDTFGRNPQDAAVSHAHYQVREKEGETRFWGPDEEEVLTLDTPEAASRAREHWHFLVTCALTVRRKVLEQVIPIPEVLVFSADGPIAAASMAMGVRVLPQPLSYYRLHCENLNAIDDRDVGKTRRRYEIGAAMHDVVRHMLIRRGVPSECVGALLDPLWIHVNRTILGSFGGSRLKALETEMRAFRFENKNPTVRYRLFKHLIVGAATLLLSPRTFYKARDWYGRRDLRRLREKFARSR